MSRYCIFGLFTGIARHAEMPSITPQHTVVTVVLQAFGEVRLGPWHKHTS